jgi:uracil phosphoribosyltransferase
MRTIKYLLNFTKPAIFTGFVGFAYYIKLNTQKAFALAKKELPSYESLPEYFEEVDNDKIMRQYPNLKILTNKAVEILIGRIRDKNLNREQFRYFSRRIIRFIVEEAVASENDKEIIKQSPLGYYKTYENPRDIEKEYVAVSIMRSGNSMVDELLHVCPDINIGKILLQRDETSQDKRPIFFFEKLPKNIENKRIFILDPMLGTGGSVNACISVLKNKGVKEENIVFLNLISCEDGLKNVFSKYPKISIITAKVDKYLLPSKYIAPGIGDFGDRYYGTDQ